MNTNVPFKDHWCLWFHDLNDKDWDNSSYKLLYTITNLNELYLIYNLFNESYFINGMYFIMKKGIMPTWEDKQNIKGGCISYKLNYSFLINTFKFLFLHCICKDLYENKDNNDYINGISISPKKTFHICKIWLSSYFDDIKKIKTYKNIITNENCIYKHNNTN
jgi:hypothetical protein